MTAPLISILIALALPVSAQSGSFTWPTPEGQPEGREATQQTLIQHPNPENDTGFAVMMFGGGLATDLHWTTPGSTITQGKTQQLTIDGEPTRDAATIASALVESGFTVLRFSSRPAGGGLGLDAFTMTKAWPFPATVTMAQAAWNQLLEDAGFEPDRVFVLGHSLGAARGVLVSDGKAAGYVFLAGAYISPQRAAPRALAQQAQNEDQDTEGIDFDDSGDIAGWERAAASAIENDTTRSHDSFTVQGVDHEWPSDVLARTEAPVLTLCGGLDPISYHAPVLKHLLGERVTTDYYKELGHTLSTEQDDLVGPIDPRVTSRIADWLKNQINSD